MKLGIGLKFFVLVSAAMLAAGGGSLFMGLPLAPVNERIQHNYQSALLITALCLVFGAIVAVMVARNFSQSIGALAAAVNRIGAGDLTARVSIKRRDELGALGDAINRMANGLLEMQNVAALAENQVRQLKLELEDKVSRRIAQLLEADLRLEYETNQRELIEHELRESEERFRLIVETAAIGMVMVDEAGKIVLVNSQIEELFGYQREELLGRDIEALLPERFRAGHLTHRKAFSAGAARHVMGRGRKLLGLCKDGTEIPLAISLRSLGNRQGRFVLASVTDLRRHLRRQADMFEAERKFRDLVESIRGIIWETETLTRKFSFVSQGAEAILGYPLQRWLEDPHFWVNVIHAEDRAPSLGFCQSMTDEGKDHEIEYRVLAADGRIVWLRDIVRVIKDEQGRPVRRRGLKIDITDRKQSEEAQRKSLGALLFLQEISELILAAEDPQTSLEEILRRCLVYCKFDLGAIFLMSYDSNSLTPVAALGYRDPANIRRGPREPRPGEEPRFRITTHGKAAVEENIQSGDRLRSLKSEGVEIALLVPVGDTDGSMGFLQLGSRKKRTIDDHEIQIAEVAARQIGIGLQKTRLLNQTKRDLNRIAALHEINLAATSTLVLDDILERLAEKVAHFLPYSADIAVKLVNRQSGRLELAVCRGIASDELAKFAAHDPHPFSDIIAKTRAALAIPDVQSHPDGLDPAFYRRNGLLSYLGVPLMIRGHFLGTLSFCTRERREFAREEVEFVQMLAGQAAMAIHNAQLYQDIREQAALLKRAKEVEAAAQAKARFLATMSHEIRTPLNAVIGLTGVMLDGELSAEQRKLAETVKQSGVGLLAIVNDILDFSKIEAGKLAIEETSFNVRKIIEAVLDIMRPQAESKGLKIVDAFAPNVPILILGDVGRLRQILLNFLSNAVKFADKGEVEVRVEVTEERSDGTLLRFAVKDEGIGISPAVQAQLFQPFTQADSSTTRKFGGTGLGLAICKRLAEIMGGSIGVKSSEGKGSTFWFTIFTKRGTDFPVAPEKEWATSELPQPEKPLQGGRVLVVEDNGANQLVAALLLEKLGYRADLAANGFEALSAIEQIPYDIVLMDCQMPEMDGYEATKRLRAQENDTGRHIPIIAMTANAMAGDREKCLAVGMDDYVTKPIQKEDLKAALERWC